MGGFLSGAWDLVRGGLLTSWLVAALFWALAGVAAASWARMSPFVGGIVGALTLFVGCLVILIYGAARKAGPTAADIRIGHGESGRGTPAGSAPPDPWFGPTGFGTTDASTTGFGTTGLGTTGSGTTGFGTTGVGATSFGTSGFGVPAGGAHFGAGGTGPSPDASVPAEPVAGSGVLRVVALTTITVVTAMFLAASFTPWVSLGIGVEIDGSDVALTPLLCTIVAVGVSAAFCWRGPRRFPAAVIAWFCSWWLLLGILALGEGGYLADTITSSAASVISNLQIDQRYADTASVTLGVGISLVALAGLAGFAWAVVAVLRRTSGASEWS